MYKYNNNYYYIIYYLIIMGYYMKKTPVGILTWGVIKLCANLYIIYYLAASIPSAFHT